MPEPHEKRAPARALTAPPTRSLRAELDRFTGRPGGREFLADHLVIDPARFRWMVIADIALGCNLQCEFCWNRGGRIELARDAVLEEVVSSILPIAESIGFGCRHEAALHPDLPELVVELNKERQRLGAKVELVLVTSGSLFDGALRAALSECGLDVVLFSIDTTDPDTFARLRPPSTWPDVRERVAAFVRDCEGGGTRVGAQAVILRSNLSSLVSTLAELASLGFVSFGASQVVVSPAGIASERVKRSGPDGQVLEDTIAGLRALGDELGVWVSAPGSAPEAVEGDIYPMFGCGRVWDEPDLRRSRPSVCAAPWTRVRVDHRGDVFPCQFMPNPKLAWGNVVDRRFEDIVNGEIAVETRAALLRGEAPNPACQQCQFGPVGPAR